AQQTRDDRRSDALVSRRRGLGSSHPPNITRIPPDIAGSKDCRIAEREGERPSTLQSCNPPILQSCNCRGLLLRGRLRLVREEALDLLHRIVDLDVERHLAECGGRATRVAADAVVLAP